MRILHYCLILVLLSIPCVIPGQSSFAEINDKAIAAYQQKDYGGAMREWKRLRAEGNADPDLSYNIGLAESLSGNLPEALLNFEKAIRYKPADTNLQKAIQQERNKIENAVIAVKPFFLVEWYKVWLAMLSPRMWALSALLLILIAVVQWLIQLGIIKAKQPAFSVNIWIPVTMGMLCLIFSILSYREIYRVNEGIIFSECPLQAGASIQSPQTRTLYQGEKIKVTDEISGWYKVKLLNLDEGWLKKECVKLIDVNEVTND